MTRKFLFTYTMLTLIMCCASAFAAEKLRYHGSSIILRSILYKAADEFKKKEGIEIDLKGKDTTYGIKKLLNGEADVTGGGRALKPLEVAKGLVQRKLFLDARVFIVQSRLPATTLSTEQLADIFLGNITDWQQIIPSVNSKIAIVSPAPSSAHYINQRKIIGYTTLPADTIYCNMPPDVFSTVKMATNYTLGYLSNSNVPEDDDIKILTITKNGQAVPVNQQNIASGAYPYVQTMYFYTAGQPKGDTKKFIDFMASEQGKKIITDAGFFLPEEEADIL